MCRIFCNGTSLLQQLFSPVVQQPRNLWNLDGIFTMAILTICIALQGSIMHRTMHNFLQFCPNYAYSRYAYKQISVLGHSITNLLRLWFRSNLSPVSSILLPIFLLLSNNFFLYLMILFYGKSRHF